jgi:hypothetical protein
VATCWRDPFELDRSSIIQLDEDLFHMIYYILGRRACKT